MTLVRPRVVTTLKPVATQVARCMAASAIPITGKRAISRAASRPGSPKQAITWPSAPSRSPSRMAWSNPGTASASS
ncbi:hypothetical protein D9M69_586910 [compost metagenome]